MTYAELLSALRSRRHVPAEEIRRVLAAAGKSADELLDQVFGDQAAPRPGDPCAECGRKLRVTNTRKVGTRRIQYLACPLGHRPTGNKIISEVCANTLANSR